MIRPLTVGGSCLIKGIIYPYPTRTGQAMCTGPDYGAGPARRHWFQCHPPDRPAADRRHRTRPNRPESATRLRVREWSSQGMPCRRQYPQDVTGLRLSRAAHRIATRGPSWPHTASVAGRRAARPGTARRPAQQGENPDVSAHGVASPPR